jgi:hypothetical protein
MDVVAFPVALTRQHSKRKGGAISLFSRRLAKPGTRRFFENRVASGEVMKICPCSLARGKTNMERRILHDHLGSLPIVAG